MMFDFLVDVATLLEVTLNPVKASVTTGTPPAPTGNCELAVWVWGNGIYHSPEPNLRGGSEATCFYRRTYDISYRIDVCMPINKDGSDLSADQWLTLSQTVYGYGDEAWCALVDNASAGTLFIGLDSCEEVTIGELQFADPQGAIASATGTIQVSYPCQAGS